MSVTALCCAPPVPTGGGVGAAGSSSQWHAEKCAQLFVFLPKHKLDNPGKCSTQVISESDDCFINILKCEKTK